MTDAEQFLADLEAKAKAATPGPWKKGIAIRRGYGVTAILDNDGNTIADMEHSHFTENEEEYNAVFIAAANPAAVLRLVGMVREYDNEILRLREEMERLEKEANWLARAASNNGWIGARISPEWMRDAARKAVEEACPKK